MTTAYLGNYVSPQERCGGDGWRRGSSNAERRKFTGDIYKCSLWGKKRENVFLKTVYNGSTINRSF
jgi:hypothetical protein